MKVNELIIALQKCDPEAEVIADGKCIYFIEQLPGYYDGDYQVLIQDKSSPYYNIKGVEFTRAKNKVRLNMMDFEDVIHNCFSEEEINNLQLNFHNSLDARSLNYYKQRINEIKTEAINQIKELNKEKK